MSEYYKFPRDEDKSDIENESDTDNRITITEEENRELAENFKKIYSILNKNTIRFKNNIYQQMMEQNPSEQSVDFSDDYKKILDDVYTIVESICNNPQNFSLDNVNNYKFPEDIKNDVYEFIKWVFEFRKSSNSVENSVIPLIYFETSLKTFPYLQK